MRSLPLVLVLVLAPAAALAGPRWASRVILDANSTTATITVGGGVTTPAFLPWGTKIHVHANAEATCCLTMSPFDGFAMGGQTTAAAMDLTDPVGPDGPGACFTLTEGSGWQTVVPYLDELRNRPGARTGVCSSASVAMGRLNGTYVRPPCRIDADCTAGGAATGSTCGTSPSQEALNASGAAILCKAVNANTDVTVMVE